MEMTTIEGRIGMVNMGYDSPRSPPNIETELTTAGLGQEDPLTADSETAEHFPQEELTEFENEIVENTVIRMDSADSKVRVAQQSVTDRFHPHFEVIT